MNPLISFVVPVFNVDKYLGQCLESILAQSYSNIEVIIVDDGSTDNSGSICDSFSAKDKRVCVIQKENGGLSSARNAGLKKASGDYIIFTDSDDFVSVVLAERMLKAMKETDADLVMCNFVYTDEHGNITGQFRDDNNSGEYGTRELLSKIAAGWTFGTVAWNKLYKKELFENGLRFSEGRIAEDEFIAHRLLANVKKAVIIPDVLCYYRQRAGSIINSTFNVKKLDSIDASIDRIEFFNSESEKKLAYISLATAMRNLAGLWKHGKDSKEIRSLLKNYRKKLKHLSGTIGKQDVQARYAISVSIFTHCFPLYLLMRKIRDFKN